MAWVNTGRSSRGDADRNKLSRQMLLQVAIEDIGQLTDI
jgi:hypothetical protein